MSAASTQGIGPVSVRYAAQIRELLYSQAVQKAAAEQEAARQIEAAKKAERVNPAPAPAVKVDAAVPAADAATVPAGEDAAPKAAPGDIVNVHV